MSPRATEIEAGHGSAVASPAQEWPGHEELIQGRLAVAGMAPREAVGPFEVEGRQHLAVEDQAADPRRVLLENAKDGVTDLLAPQEPVALLEPKGCVLDVHRHHVRSLGSERGIDQSRDADVQPRPAGSP